MHIQVLALVQIEAEVTRQDYQVSTIQKTVDKLEETIQTTKVRKFAKFDFKMALKFAFLFYSI